MRANVSALVWAARRLSSVPLALDLTAGTNPGAAADLPWLAEAKHQWDPGAAVRVGRTVRYVGINTAMDGHGCVELCISRLYNSIDVG